MRNRFISRTGCFVFTLAFAALDGGVSNSQEQPKEVKSEIAPKSPADSKATLKGLDTLKADVGTWDAEVTLWLRPGSDPIKSHAVVTASMAVGDMYLEQRFEGTFGPELGNKTWTSVSYTNFIATSGLYETVRMASSGTPMIVLRGKAMPGDDQGGSMELTGEYTMTGAKATERDVIRHEGPDKCVIESWMSFGGAEEFRGAEMVLTRGKRTLSSEHVVQQGDSQMRLGNFSISLAVKDLVVSRTFYEKLGFRAVAGNAKNYVIMQNDTSTIGLFQGMFDKNILTYNPGWDRNCATLPDFEDVRKIQRLLREQGIVPTVAADETTTGPTSFTLVDPDGNAILFDQHVPSPK